MVIEDIYLSLAAELYEKGTWDKETLHKKVMLYAKDKNIDMTLISEFLKRLTKDKEYTIEEKRKFLSVLTFDGHELKYGNALETVDDDTIDKFYQMETALMDIDSIDKFHSLAKEEKNKVNLGHNTIIVKPRKKKLDNLEHVKKEINVSDILSGNYSNVDLMGLNEQDKTKIFNKLLNSVTPKDFNEVVLSLESKAGSTYSRNFAIEWAKLHSIDLSEDENKQENTTKSDELTEENLGEVLGETTFIESLKAAGLIQERESKKSEEIIMESEIIDDSEANKEEIVVPELKFGEEGMPETEEEYKKQAQNILDVEKDSDVKIVSASKERVEKLKKNKGKIVNYFLKTAIVIASLSLLTPTSSIALIGGYLIFSNKIKNGDFNPENPVGKAIKSGVEKIMYMGMSKEEIEYERGRSR